MAIYYTTDGGLGDKTDKRILELFVTGGFSKHNGREFAISDWPDGQT